MRSKKNGTAFATEIPFRAASVPFELGIDRLEARGRFGADLLVLVNRMRDERGDQRSS